MDDVSDRASTASYGIKKMKKSGEYISSAVQMSTSKETEKNRKIIREYERRGDVCIYRTVILCILVIFVTILICIFL